MHFLSPQKQFPPQNYISRKNPGQGKSPGDTRHELSENFVCQERCTLHSLTGLHVACEATPNYMHACFKNDSCSTY